ncbi:hypothetical protein SDC9_06198 [bioreactor metagenome]|uniref:Uncharacterized protein n=1 Tax=bioreactor metagenome TaxID=1076179 RepID=A0A644T2B3_9ZZZZ|nr:hypothetical protein [Negativicutes bacterium]
MNNMPNKTIVILLWTAAIIVIGMIVLQAHIGEIQKAPHEMHSDSSFQTIDKPDNLGLTPAQFKERFNASAENFDNNLKIKTLNIMTGVAQDTFNVRLATHTSLLGTLNDSGMLRSITIIGLGDGSIGSNSDTALAIGILVASFNPNLSLPECYQIIRDTGITDSNSLATGQTIRDGKRYIYTRSNDNKVMFSVSKAIPNNNVK